MRNLHVLVLFLLFNFALGCMKAIAIGNAYRLGYKLPEKIRRTIIYFENAPVDQRDRLYPSEKLMPGDYLLSKYRKYVVLMNGDGQLLIFGKDGDPFFQANANEQGSHLKFQNDGNLVLYSSRRVPKWSAGLYKRDLCSTDRCVLIIQDDGNLVAYRGDVQPRNAFWSSRSSSQGEFNDVASRDFEAVCPVFESPKLISSVLLSPDSKFAGYWPFSEDHDELGRRRKRAIDEDDENGVPNRASVFDAFAATTPDWLTHHEELIFPINYLNRYVSPQGQTVYYLQRHVGGFLGFGGYQTARYVGSIVRPAYLNSGQETTDQSRAYTNRMVERSGVDARTNPDMYQSFDAGHVLMRLMGGTVEEWNLFPQYGRMNRVNWNNLERSVARRIVNENVIVVAEYLLQYERYDAIPDYVHYSFRFFDARTPRGNYISSILGVYENIVPTGQRLTYRNIYNNEGHPVLIAGQMGEVNHQTDELILTERARVLQNHFECLLNPARRGSPSG